MVVCEPVALAFVDPRESNLAGGSLGPVHVVCASNATIHLHTRRSLELAAPTMEGFDLPMSFGKKAVAAKSTTKGRVDKTKRAVSRLLPKGPMI